MLVHFICRGNVFRSLIADTYLRSLNLPNVTVMSSGTVADLYRESNKPLFDKHVQLLKNHGLAKYVKHHPEQLTKQRLNNNDIIVVVNDIAYKEAKTLATFPSNAIVWDITDIGEGTRTKAYENGRVVEEVVYDEIIAKVDELVGSVIVDYNKII